MKSKRVVDRHPWNGLRQMQVFSPSGDYDDRIAREWIDVDVFCEFTIDPQGVVTPGEIVFRPKGIDA